MTCFYKVCLTDISGLSFINKKSVTSISYISNGFTLSNNLITSLDSYISVKLPDNSSLHSSAAHLFPSHEEVNRWSASVQILGCVFHCQIFITGKILQNGFGIVEVFLPSGAKVLSSSNAEAVMAAAEASLGVLLPTGAS